MMDWIPIAVIVIQAILLWRAVSVAAFYRKQTEYYRCIWRQELHARLEREEALCVSSVHIFQLQCQLDCYRQRRVGESVN